MSYSEPEVARIVALLETGMSQRNVAHTCEVSRSTVQYVYKRYLETGGHIRRSGSGRGRKTSARDDRFIVSTCLRNRHRSAVEVQTMLRQVRNVNVSEWTVRRRLREQNLKPYRPATGPKLTTAHKVARLRFAHEHSNWTLDQWGQVLFSDESRMTVCGSDGRNRVYRRPGERYAECTLAERVSFGGGSIMFWAGISLEARTELVILDRGTVTAASYVSNILEQHVMPYTGLIGNRFLLMHDNARPHTAILVRNYLQEVGIAVMEWPARSPDLNPIEHL